MTLSGTLPQAPPNNYAYTLHVPLCYTQVKKHMYAHIRIHTHIATRTMVKMLVNGGGTVTSNFYVAKTTTTTTSTLQKSAARNELRGLESN